MRREKNISLGSVPGRCTFYKPEHLEGEEEELEPSGAEEGPAPLAPLDGDALLAQGGAAWTDLASSRLPGVLHQVRACITCLLITTIFLIFLAVGKLGPHAAALTCTLHGAEASKGLIFCHMHTPDLPSARCLEDSRCKFPVASLNLIYQSASDAKPGLLQVSGMRSNVWPGAYAAASGKIVSNIYVGWAIKSAPFMPMPPPLPAQEFAAVPLECTELPLRPELETEVVEGEAGEGQED